MIMNDTITELLVNGSIPLNVTVNNSTNWVQFLTSIVITLIGTFGLFFILYFPSIISSMKIGSLRKLTRFTGRSVVLIKHTAQGLFSSEMIDQRCLRELSQVMNKMEGKDFDLVLHTPGGEIFSSLAISRMINQYPGTIRAIIPLYSMSGGSLLALSCEELLMTPNACIGPIDPQLGSLFRYGSAKAWEEIVKFKGKKAEDQSISFAMMGKQHTKSIKAHLNSVVDLGMTNNNKKKLIEFLTDGKVEHAYPLTINDLEGYGIMIHKLKNVKFLSYLTKIIGKRGKEGVHYYKI